MIDADVLRAWWAHRQRLDGTGQGAEPADLLATTGWARSVGGAGPYLTFHARARTARPAVDAAVAALAVHELPSARGCTYIVPAEHYAVALTLSQGTVGEVATLGRLGVPAGEVEALADAVVDALEGEELDPADMRDRLGDRVRSLGEEGRRKGVSTTLPAALGLLQTHGRIRRVPVNGRLDQQRYRYARWDDGPLAAGGPSVAEARAELARLFFSWAGPATIAQFRWFSGLGAKAAQEAMRGLELIEVGGPVDGLLMPPADAKELAGYIRPAGPQVELVAGTDAVALLRRDAEALIGADDLGHPLLASLGGRSGGRLADLPSHAIVDRGRVIGLWEFDPAEGAVVWATFAPPAAAVREAVAETEVFVRSQLDDARSFSLDSPASRQGRLDALWAAQR